MNDTAHESVGSAISGGGSAGMAASIVVTVSAVFVAAADWASPDIGGWPWVRLEIANDLLGAAAVACMFAATVGCWQSRSRHLRRPPLVYLRAAAILVFVACLLGGLVLATYLLPALVIVWVTYMRRASAPDVQ
jgi:hypothetical protein